MKNSIIRYSTGFIAGALALVSILLLAPLLFHNDLVRNHDFQIGYIKAATLSDAWSWGYCFPRWAPHTAGGYGYPGFNYYAPLFSFIAATLAFILPLLTAFNLAVLLVFFGAGMAMYLFARDLWGRTGGALSAVLYLVAPYHLCNVYVRGAVAELTGYCCLPLVLWGMNRAIFTNDRRGTLVAVVATALFCLSHNITMMIFFPVLLGYVLLTVFTVGGDRRQHLFKAGLPIGIGILATAFFWLPAIAEKGFVKTSIVQFTLDAVRSSFIAPERLFYSSWGDGVKTSMGLMIGPVLMGAVLIAVVFLAVGRNITVRQRWYGAFFLSVFLGTLFMTTPFSELLWRACPALGMVTFSWRFLTIATFAGSVLAGAIVLVLPSSRWLVAGGSAVLMILSVIPYAKPFSYENGKFPLEKNVVKYASPMDSMEFLPVNAMPPGQRAPEEKLVPVQGKALLARLHGSTEIDRRYHVTVLEPALFVYFTYYFPGWKVHVDGRETEIHYKEIPSGIMAFAVPPGEHDVRIFFTDTPVRTLANILSLGTLGLFFLWFFLPVGFIYPWRRKHP